MNINYTIIKSRRRTISIEIKPGGDLVVRAPYFTSKGQIERFVKSKEAWIVSHLEKREKLKTSVLERGEISQEEINSLRLRAKETIPVKVEYYRPLVENVSQKSINIGRITIKSQKTLWGSCSAKGNLNFNCLLMKCPESVIDYVVVHELCHRVEMNHSQKFWKLVEKVCPNYKEERKWLKNQGHLLMEQLRISVDK